MARRLFSRLSLVSIVAVAVAVAVQLMVLSVMRGFRDDLMSKMIGLHPHLRMVTEENTIPAVPGVTLVPSVEGEGILTAGEGMETGIKIRGVTPQSLAEMSSLVWALPEGADPVSVFSKKEGNPQVVIGSELAAQIGASPEGGRRINLIAPFGQVTPAGDLAPNRVAAQVGGIFKSGLYEVDQSLVMMDLATARQLLGPQATLGFWGYVADPMHVDQVAMNLRDHSPTLSVRTWQEDNAALFGALRLERIVMTTLLVVVVGIAATGIIGVLMMTGLARQREVGIMLALGATARQVRQIFIAHGAMMGVTGSAIGIGLAAMGCGWIARGGIPLPESLYLHTLPVALSWPGAVLIGLGGACLTTVAAWIPTRELHPTDIMHWLKGE